MLKSKGSYPLMHKSNTVLDAEAVQRVRLVYSKKGPICLISHLDLGKTLFAIFRRAGLPLAYTHGFNPQPRVQFGPPLSVGYESEHELIDVYMAGRADLRETLKRVNEQAPHGIFFSGAQEVDLKAPSLGAAAMEAEYLAVLPQVCAPEEVETSVARFRNGVSFEVEIERKKGTVKKDLKKCIHISGIEKTAAGNSAIRLTASLSSEDYVNPITALAHILGLVDGQSEQICMTRMAIRLKKS